VGRRAQTSTRRHRVMPWHRTPQEAFAFAGVECGACDLRADDGYEYAVVKTTPHTQKKRASPCGCFQALFPRRWRARPPVATRVETENGQPAMTRRLSEIHSKDVTSLHAMRAELDKALEQAVAQRERLRDRRLQTARASAGVAAHHLDALDSSVMDLSVGEKEEGTNGTSLENQSVVLSSNDKHNETRVSPTKAEKDREIKMENLSESIARALEPVRAFCDSRNREPGSVSELARGFEELKK